MLINSTDQFGSVQLRLKIIYHYTYAVFTQRGNYEKHILLNNLLEPTITTTIATENMQKFFHKSQKSFEYILHLHACSFFCYCAVLTTSANVFYLSFRRIHHHLYNGLFDYAGVTPDGPSLADGGGFDGCFGYRRDLVSRLISKLHRQSSRTYFFRKTNQPQRNK